MWSVIKNKQRDDQVQVIKSSHSNLDDEIPTASFLADPSRSSYVVVISIIMFNKYFQTVFSLMDLNISPTFNQLFQSETVNTKKNYTTNNTIEK